MQTLHVLTQWVGGFSINFKEILEDYRKIWVLWCVCVGMWVLVVLVVYTSAAFFGRLNLASVEAEIPAKRSSCS